MVRQYGIACDSTGQVYAADTANNHIQVFTAEGKFLSMFGQQSREFSKPAGIGVDTSNHDMVYVCEANNKRVSVFTSEGQFVTSFGRQGYGPGEFMTPCGIAVDTTGVVYVCDFHTVQIF